MIKKLVFASCLTAIALFVFSGCEPSSGTNKADLAKYVMRVNCGAVDPYTDKAGNEWLPDQYMEEGQQWGAVYGMTIERGDLGITGTDAPKIYETERYSMDAYEFAVPNGKYTVRLHFAETYEGITDAGMRVFSVTINDKTVIKDLDILDTAGGPEKPIVKEFKGVKVTDGKLVIAFVPDIENPEINGIEILSE
jgi:endoglucanase